MKKESVARGTVVLALAGIVVRLLGFMYRVPLARWIGTEGLGLYQMVQPAYHALLAIGVGGIPTALSTLVAEYEGRGRPHVGRQALNLALVWVTVTAGAAAVGLLIWARPIALLLGDARAEIPLLALSPAVFFFAVGFCYRGYLYGRQYMTPTAVGNVLEQAGRTAGALGAAAMLLPMGLAWGAAGAAFGASVGAVACLLYWLRACSRGRGPAAPTWDPGESNRRLVRMLASLSWPLTAGALFLPGLSFVDVALVQRGLRAAGLSVASATSLYGQFSGMVYPLVSLPSVLSGALATALLPVLTLAWTRGDRDEVHRRCLLGLQATAMLGLPAAAGLVVMARPVLGAVFGTPEAAPILGWAAPIAFLSPLAGILASALQALGHTGLPVRNFTVGMVIKVCLDTVLTRVPGMGILGVAMASVIAYCVCCWLSARDLEAAIGAPIPWGRVLGGPLLAAAGMTAGLLGLMLTGWSPGGAWGKLVMALVVGPVLYALLLGALGVFTRAKVERTGLVSSPLVRRWLRLWPF